MFEQNLELNSLIAPATARFKSNKPQAVSTYFVNRWRHHSVSYPTSQGSALSCVTEEECCKCHWRVLQLTLQAVTSHKSPPWHYTAVVWTENRIAVLSGCGLWNKAVLQEKKTKTTPKHPHCTIQMCQVSGSPCIPHLAKGNMPCISIPFLLCSFSSSCPSFHFYRPSPSVFNPKVHFRNSRVGPKVNILDFSHQFCSMLLPSLPRVL